MPGSIAHRPIRVPATLHAMSRFFAITRRFWTVMGALESWVLRDELDAQHIDTPIYVGSVPRSGTTIITELISRHGDVASHHYSDFPAIHTPYWRNWLYQRTGRHAVAPVERAHQDRLMITPDSPEAVEEVLWMQFFPHLHDPHQSNVLGGHTRHSKFERYYQDHIRKLLLVRNGARYLTKGNYNTWRLPYIAHLHPSARFIIPVRNPLNHIASLMKQDHLFTVATQQDPRVERQLHLSGHFEFGPRKRPVNLGDRTATDAVLADWDACPVRGWARYWALLHQHLLDQLDRHPALKSAALLVRYEDLCRRPGAEIDRIIGHCGLDPDRFVEVRAEYSRTLAEPEYYQPTFSATERELIGAYTNTPAQRLGYAPIEA